jgi:NAD(P)-dependent dehydrogenase (short-subunit alcohol dehydrogenase family)
VSLITGAGSGIGRATSRIFAREGAKLVLADVVEEGGNQTLKMVQGRGRSRVISARCEASVRPSENGTFTS